MIQIKHGVKLSGLRPEMVLATTIIEGVYDALGLPLVITSGRDGRHGRGSFHYQGGALDYGTKVVPREKLHDLRLTCAQHLGAEYDVVLEDMDSMNEHLHVEFQPKE